MPRGTIRRPSAAELLGVREQPKNARDRLLDTAIELFYRRGFNAVGLDQIIAEVGVTKTTFYNHFEGKDQLMVEAVKRREAWETQAWSRAVSKLAGDDPRARLLAYFDVLDAWFNDPDFHGCIFLNAAAEFPNPNDPVHAVGAAHKRRSRDGWRDLAVEARLSDPEGFADAYTLLIEGALVMRQIHGRDDAARLARRSVERLLEDHTPAA